MANLLPQTIFETDETGNLTFANLYAFKQFGYKKERFHQKTDALQLIAPQDRKRAEKDFNKMILGKKVKTSEYLAIRKDKSTFPAIIYESPIIKENKVAGIRGIIIDITE